MWRIPPFFAGPAIGKRDYLTEIGAQELACRIMDRWHASGQESVFAWPVKMPSLRKNSPKPIYGVATNLINGMPPP